MKLDANDQVPFCPPYHNTTATLPCGLQRMRFGCLQVTTMNQYSVVVVLSSSSRTARLKCCGENNSKDNCGNN